MGVLIKSKFALILFRSLWSGHVISNRIELKTKADSWCDIMIFLSFLKYGPLFAYFSFVINKCRHVNIKSLYQCTNARWKQSINKSYFILQSFLCNIQEFNDMNSEALETFEMRFKIRHKFHDINETKIPYILIIWNLWARFPTCQNGLLFRFWHSGPRILDWS